MWPNNTSYGLKSISSSDASSRQGVQVAQAAGTIGFVCILSKTWVGNPYYVNSFNIYWVPAMMWGKGQQTLLVKGQTIVP